MFGLEIFRINWAYLALFGGLVGILATILTYWMIWSPRTDPKAETAPPTTGDALKQIPWIIWLTLAGIFAYSIYHLIVVVRNPPNW